MLHLNLLSTLRTQCHINAKPASLTNSHYHQHPQNANIYNTTTHHHKWGSLVEKNLPIVAGTVRTMLAISYILVHNTYFILFSHLCIILLFWRFFLWWYSLHFSISTFIYQIYMHIWYQKMSKHVKLQIVLEEHNLLPSKLIMKWSLTSHFSLHKFQICNSALQDYTCNSQTNQQTSSSQINHDAC